ncbi:MAG: glycosyltransferase family 39 protein [Myxococcales bacterium]|nr:MAG: glycosyltransferase family 39 protein [Myxococcales bacterium]
MSHFSSLMRRPALKGSLLAFLSATVLFLLMAQQQSTAFGIWLGLPALLLSAYGLTRAILVTLDAEEQGTSTAHPLCLPPVHHPGWFVFGATLLLLLPALGLYSLSDPWETHYGEVAREILARNDWISLWWAQDKWFWSKPILIFWTEALSMKLWGTGFMPDTNPSYAEWAIRFPHLLFSTAAIMAVYFTVARLWEKRTAVFCALVLLTCPYFFLISHQAITDSLLVSNLTIAMCFLTLAFVTPENEALSMFRVWKTSFSLKHLFVFSLLLLVLPQILYLASRNVSWGSGGIFFHYDSFLYGSAGNDAIPGNPAHQFIHPVFGSIAAQPVMQAAYWAVALAAALFFARRLKSKQSFFFLFFYLFCAIAFMAKGLPGIVLPGLAALFYLIVSRRWSLLGSGHIHVALGILLILCIGAPWFVAMYMRHGAAFTDRLLVHDHINRLAQGVHGDKGSMQYFLEQLGVGLFPWVGLVPAALGYSVVQAYREEQHFVHLEQQNNKQAHATMLWGLWLLTSFTLFSAMITKFHHYAYPIVPPAALLVGLIVSRLWASSDRSAETRWLSILLCILGVAALVLGLAGFFGDPRGLVPLSVESASRWQWTPDHGWPLWLCTLLLSIGTLSFYFAYRFSSVFKQRAPALSRAAIATIATAAVLIAFVGRDLSWITDVRPAGYERLLQLFVYRYEREWPTQFDYRAILSGFAILSTVLISLALFTRLRRLMLMAFFSCAFLFAVWGLDLYLIDLGPHWGQRELIKAYYEHRSGPDEPLLAWQMNWKGENFYTGNRVYAFIELDNKAITKWVKEHKGQRAFFVLQHERLANFKRLMGASRTINEITTVDENNKFILLEISL